MSDDLSKPPSIASVVPYLMVLAVISMLGFLFLTISLPLLADALSSKTYRDLGHLITESIDRTKSGFASSGSSNFTFAAAALFLSLPVGYMVQQLSGFLATVFSLIVGRLLVNRLPPIFCPRQFLSKDHGAFKIWLLENRACKLEWEWEFVNYCIYWGLFTNVVIWVLLCFLLVTNYGWSLLFVCPVFCLFLLAQCIGRSRTMLLIHEVCLSKSGLKQEATPSPASLSSSAP